MAARTTTTIPARIASARLIISNSINNQEIQNRVATRGYTTDVLQQGQRLLEVAVQAVDAQAAAAGAQELATDQAETAEQAARSSYQQLVQTVRAVFPAHSPQRKALDVVGSMPQKSAEFTTAASTLFNNAINVPEIATVLAKFGYPVQTLRDEYAIINAYQQALHVQANAKSAAKHATRDQKESLEALDQWFAQYVKIARIALRDQPDLLKSLGITLGQRGRPKGKAAASKEEKAPGTERRGRKQRGRKKNAPVPVQAASSKLASNGQTAEPFQQVHS